MVRVHGVCCNAQVGTTRQTACARTAFGLFPVESTHVTRRAIVALAQADFRITGRDAEARQATEGTKVVRVEKEAQSNITPTGRMGMAKNDQFSDGSATSDTSLGWAHAFATLSTPPVIQAALHVTGLIISLVSDDEIFETHSPSASEGSSLHQVDNEEYSTMIALEGHLGMDTGHVLQSKQKVRSMLEDWEKFA